MQNQDQNTETESADDNKPQRPLDIPGSAYAQSNAGGMRSPGAYASAYSANAFSSKTNASTDTNDRRLTIGRGITMSGEIEACDHLLVEGTVEAALKGASKLDIAESGVFYGTVSIEEAEVAGRFEGEITVNGRLTIRSTGTITGSISYKELEVESGAVIDGRITPISAENQRSQPKNQGRKDSPQTLKAPPREPQAANSDGELFSERERAAAE